MKKTAASITESRLGFAKQKPDLAVLYREWYQHQRKHLALIDGEILELGSGAGFIKQEIADAKTSDVIPSMGTDYCLNALDIGEQLSNCLSNILMVNAFHHINDSERFLKAVDTALKPRGRLIMIEPWLNAWSTLCYRLVGHEPLNPDQKGWSFPSADPLLDSNQAQPWIVFSRDKKRLRQEFPSLNILLIKPMMPFSYLLTGGHGFPTGLPEGCIKVCRSIEKRWLDQNLGMFALIVVEKSA
jgi:SAM-dependent methyltransferase